MFGMLNDEIARVKGDIHRKRKWEMQLEGFQADLLEIENEIGRLQDQLKDEKADVRKLEGFSLTSFFSSLSGTKYEKLDKEKKEVLAVQIKLEKAEKTRREILDSLNVVNGKLLEVKDSEKEYERLLAEKEELLKQGNSVYGEELLQISEQVGETEAYQKELQEAVSAGENAYEALNFAANALDSAKGWGTWDMFGGGMLSTAMKHSKMDDAANHVSIAQTRMRTFQKELVDVNELIAVDLDVSGLLKFADFFFDGFIVDWMVQGRINDSLDQVFGQLTKVEEIVNNLNTELDNTKEKLVTLQQKRQTLLESL